MLWCVFRGRAFVRVFVVHPKLQNGYFSFFFFVKKKCYQFLVHCLPFISSKQGPVEKWCTIFFLGGGGSFWFCPSIFFVVVVFTFNSGWASVWKKRNDFRPLFTLLNETDKWRRFPKGLLKKKIWRGKKKACWSTLGAQDHLRCGSIECYYKIWRINRQGGVFCGIAFRCRSCRQKGFFFFFFFGFTIFRIQRQCLSSLPPSLWTFFWEYMWELRKVFSSRITFSLDHCVFFSGAVLVIFFFCMYNLALGTWSIQAHHRGTQK